MCAVHFTFCVWNWCRDITHLNYIINLLSPRSLVASPLLEQWTSLFLLPTFGFALYFHLGFSCTRVHMILKCVCLTSLTLWSQDKSAFLQVTYIHLLLQ